MEWPWLVLLGLGTGAFGITVGTGGGLVLVPMLLLLSDMESAAVAGTSLFLVAINSMSGSIAYLRRGLLDRRSGLLFGLAAIPGSVIAPFLVEIVGFGAFRVLFAVLLLGLGVQMLIFRPVPRSTRVPRHVVRAGIGRRHIETHDGQVFDYEYSGPLAAAFNAVLGFISAFFGTGGGYLRTPVLVSAFGFPVRIAVATSVLALSLYATVGAAVHAYLGHVDWYLTLVWAGIGLIAGAQIGARLAATVRTRWILRLLTVLLLVMGACLLVQGVFGA